VLKSDLYTSLWGDQWLFFRHQRVTKDLHRSNFPREWRAIDDIFETFPDNHYDGFTGIDSWPTDEAAAEQEYMYLKSEAGGKCPFSWLFE